MKDLPGLADGLRLHLRLDAQLRRLETVGLGHGVFRAVEAVQDQLPEEGEAHLAVHTEVLLPVLVHQEHVIALPFLLRQVNVLADLDIALGTQNKGAPIPPGAKAIGGKPIHAEIVVAPLAPTMEQSP